MVLRRALVALALVAALVAAGGVAVARSTPALETSGPTSVTGTEATGVFQIADRTIRQVRYADGGTLRYSFEVTNDSRLPLTILGLAADQPKPRLFALERLSASVHLLDEFAVDVGVSSHRIAWPGDQPSTDLRASEMLLTMGGRYTLTW